MFIFKSGSYIIFFYTLAHWLATLNNSTKSSVPAVIAKLSI